MTKKRILFLSEAATLFHVVRPLALAQKLDSENYDVLLALDSRFNRFLGDLSVPVQYIKSVEARIFEKAISRGTFFYTQRILEEEIIEDLKVIEEFKPDIIVSDLRLSTSISARVKKIPLVCLTNLCWSPFIEIAKIVPEVFWTRIFGRRLSQLAFSAAFPIGSRLLAKPFSKARKHYGLPAIAPDFLSVLCDGELTLYADIPNLTPVKKLPPSHHFLGPIIWQSQLSLPHWWDDFLKMSKPGGLPRIYLNLGSSGVAGMTDKFVHKLLELGGIVVAVGLHNPAKISSKRFFHASFLPNHMIMPHCDLYINNSGVSSHQGFEYGLPCIGLAHNMDQFRNGTLMEQAGLGICLPVFHTSPENLRQQTQKMLMNTKIKNQVLQTQKWIQKFDLASTFTAELEKVI